MWTLALPAVVFLATTSVVFVVAWWMQQKLISPEEVADSPSIEKSAPAEQDSPLAAAFATQPPVSHPGWTAPDLSVEALRDLGNNALDDPDEGLSEAEDFDCGTSQVGQFAQLMQDERPRKQAAPAPRPAAEQLEEGSMDAASFGSLFSAIDEEPSR